MGREPLDVGVPELPRRAHGEGRSAGGFPSALRPRSPHPRGDQKCQQF